ncbi:MAG: hypothetical protein OFPII_38130 [Osedax symbiont Rs1]|nr:MAG: hypothetical protein OFPII_38130 [Osedax symbiont Rs1]
MKNIIIERALLFLASILLVYLSSLVLSTKDLNNSLLDQHYNKIEKTASDTLAIIAIDDDSIAYYESWPWPRSIYAEIIQKLNNYTIKKLAFDIDFSSKSSLVQDMSFAKSLKTADYPIALSAYISESNDQQSTENTPIIQLAKNATIVNANVSTTIAGTVYIYSPTAINSRISIASFLADRVDKLKQDFYIDYSYSLGSIPVYSVKDLLLNKIPLSALRNKNILIGATSIALGDMFNMPVNGRKSGVFIHALAYETAIRGKQFTKTTNIDQALIALIVILLLIVSFNRRNFLLLLISSISIFFTLYFFSIYLHHYHFLITELASSFISLITTTLFLFLYAFYIRTRSFYRQLNIKNYHKSISDQLIKSSSHGIIVTNRSGDILIINHTAKNIFPLESSHLNIKHFFERGLQLIAACSTSDQQKTSYHKIRHVNSKGITFDLEVFVDKSYYTFNKMQGIFKKNHELYNIIIIDETEKNQALEDFSRSKIELLDIKYNDPLTKIANRYSFDNYLKKSLEKEHVEQLSVVLISLDSLQDINFIYGGLIGDSIICQVAGQLASSVGDNGKVFTFSRETFAIVYSGLSEAQVLRNMQKIFFLFSNPLSVVNQQVLMSVSLGMAMAPKHAHTPSLLTSCAETALNHAHTSQAKNYAIYDQKLAVRLKQRAVLKKELRRAINNREFLLHYQPQHCLASGALVGLEGLLRWNDPEHGLRYPDEFIVAAEEFGFMGELGELVLSLGCNDGVQLPEHIKIALNVSPVQFLESDVAELCEIYLHQSGLAAHRLELEITESMLMEDIGRVCEILQLIKNLGVSIAMDDFGTGYSSLQYLTQLPFDKLKIDRSFSMKIGLSQQDDDIIISIIQLGKAANKTILAEGIETEHSVNFLKAHGCEMGQGYFFGKPQPLAYFLKN